MSDYADQLRAQSFGGLFPPEMEDEFQAYQQSRDLTRARSGLSAMILLVVTMLVADTVMSGHGIGDRVNVLRFTGIGLPFAICLAASYWGPIRGAFPQLVAGVFVLASTSSILITVSGAASGAPYYSSGLIVLMLVNYFVLGLEWRLATAVGISVLGIFTATNLVAGYFGPGFVLNFIFLTYANWAGVVGARQRSQSRRLGFLEHRVAEELSGLDQLTGLHNRRRLDQELDLYWRRAERGSQPLSVALIDIDYFKPYNDRLGHQAGDTCLREVAQLIAKQARDTDFVGRYGGEEFALLLPGIDSHGASVVAERLREAVATENLPHPASTVAPHVTVSIGVSTVWPGDTNRSLQGFVQMADESLYEAKGAGRNIVVACTDEDSLVQTGVFKLPPTATSATDTGRMRRDN